MKINLELISQNDLFEGIDRSDFQGMLACLAPSTKAYQKGEFVLHMGDCVDFVGIVVAGEIKIMKLDDQGGESILHKIPQGEVFAEVFACANVTHSPVSIVAEADSQILFLDYRRIITTCSASCTFHQRLIANMLRIMAARTLQLNQKIEVISQKTLRRKILVFLHAQAKGERHLEIDLNREELAAYLCADRSALSGELSKMQKDGLIRYHKNKFEILV